MAKYDKDTEKVWVISIVIVALICIILFIGCLANIKPKTQKPSSVNASTVEGEVMEIEPSQTYVIEENTSEAQPMFDFVYSRPNCQIGYFVDQETGVNYIIVFANDGGLSITPRLDSNGDICVSEGTLYIENEDLETYHP